MRDATRRLRALDGAEVTYAEVGATADAVLPSGYRHVEWTIALGAGREVFDRAATALLGWRMHETAGLRVSGPPVAPGVNVIVAVGRWPLVACAPCRVVAVTDQPHRRGFAYGTLPGHPETGEEAFHVSIDDDSAVTFTVWAFSRPATWWARLGSPVNNLVQDVLTRRYLAAMRALAPGE